MADSFDTDRLAKIEALITVYDDAITAIITNGAQSYTLDTGQSRQVVTKIDAGRLQLALDRLVNQRAVLNARCTGAGSTNVRPAW